MLVRDFKIGMHLRISVVGPGFQIDLHLRLSGVGPGFQNWYGFKDN